MGYLRRQACVRTRVRTLGRVRTGTFYPFQGVCVWNECSGRGGKVWAIDDAANGVWGVPTRLGRLESVK